MKSIFEGLLRAARVVSSTKASDKTKKAVSTSTVSKQEFRKGKHDGKMIAASREGKLSNAFTDKFSAAIKDPKSPAFDNHKKNFPTRTKLKSLVSRHSSAHYKAYEAGKNTTDTVGKAHHDHIRAKAADTKTKKEDVQMEYKQALVEGLKRALRVGTDKAKTKESLRQTYRGAASAGSISAHRNRKNAEATGRWAWKNNNLKSLQNYDRAFDAGLKVFKKKVASESVNEATAVSAALQTLLSKQKATPKPDTGKSYDMQYNLRNRPEGKQATPAVSAALQSLIDQKKPKTGKAKLSPKGVNDYAKSIAVPQQQDRVTQRYQMQGNINPPY